MEELQVTATEGQHGARILRLQGPLTLATLFDFQSIARQEDSPLIIDLSAVPYMDSAGLGSLLGLLASAQRRHTGFAVAGASARVRVLFQVARVEVVLPLYATVDDAEASLAQAAGAGAGG